MKLDLGNIVEKPISTDAIEKLENKSYLQKYHSYLSDLQHYNKYFGIDLPPENDKAIE
jgi:hypothetical protein